MRGGLFPWSGRQRRAGCDRASSCDYGRGSERDCSRVHAIRRIREGIFLHGLAMECAEALAEYLHRLIREELEIDRGQGHRYSFGYASCPDLSHQATIFRLLDAENAIGTHLTSAYQIVPEQSTLAFIVHHPDAKYFTSKAWEWRES